MWNILGGEALYLDIPEVFKKNLLAHVADDEKGKKFREFMDKTETEFLLNGQTEENCFILGVPDELTPEDIQLMADVILDTLKSFEGPAVTVDGTEQKYKIVISNNREPEIVGLRKTPGMSSMEVFKPIIYGWDAPGRANPSMSRFYSE